MIDSDTILKIAHEKADAEYDETCDTDFHPDPETIQYLANTLGIGKMVSVLAADILRERREEDEAEA